MNPILRFLRAFATYALTMAALILAVDSGWYGLAYVLGAAALARMALEPSLSLADAVPAWTPSDVVEPRWSADRAGSFLERWDRAVVSTTGAGR